MLETSANARLRAQTALHVLAYRTMARLTFGPEAYGGSSWVKPGDEWGTGFIFPEAGCWRVHAQRDDLVGDLYLLLSR